MKRRPSLYVEEKRIERQKAHPISRGLAFVMLLILLAQPTAPLFADELASDTTSASTATESAPPESSPESPSETVDTSSEPSVADEAPSDESDTSEQIEPEESIQESEAETGNNSDATLPPETETEQSSGDSVPAIEIPTPDIEPVVEVPDESAEIPVPVEDGGEVVASTTNDVIPEPVLKPEDEIVEPTEDIEPTLEDEFVDEEASASSTPSETAATTTPVVVDPLIENTLTNDTNRFSFGADDCVAMGDGTFYCTTASSTEVAAPAGTDRIFSAPDSTGDKEIYVERDGELATITTNDYDDDAPFYDETSNAAVWHRLIDGRYQIISYNFDTEEEEQLTSDRYNNMQPARGGDTIVWQGWIGNDWEIMLLENDELVMLTDNTTDDIAPRITGDYIMWQAHEDGAWRVKVYDRNTKQTETIADADGASLDNPRFVLVYDTKHENGDIETKGYDPESGKVVALAATPGAAPKEIPKPDQTGENRAFVQAPVAVKTKSELVSDDLEAVDGIIDDPATTTGDIVITPLIDETVAEYASSTDHTDVIVVPDLVISSTSPAVEHIEDLIITPYVEPIVETPDPQFEVASST